MAKVVEIGEAARKSAPSKPSYLGMLNAIALGEARGYAVLDAWATATTDSKLRNALTMVAIRENEHARAFEKRLCELGFELKPKSAAGFSERLACASSTATSDLDKFDQVLGYRETEPEPNGGDTFAQLFDDPSIDPVTGALLGRFIAEERDSGRMLRAEYRRLRKDVRRTPTTQAGALKDIAERLDRLTTTLQELKALRQS